MNDVMVRYRRHCYAHALDKQSIKEVVNDGTFTKLIGYNNNLIFATKNRTNYDPRNIKNYSTANQ